MLVIIYYIFPRNRLICKSDCLCFVQEGHLAKSLREAVNQDRERQRAKDEHGLK
jgi:hypothetical protein